MPSRWRPPRPSRYRKGAWYHLRAGSPPSSSPCLWASSTHSARWPACFQGTPLPPPATCRSLSGLKLIRVPYVVDRPTFMGSKSRSKSGRFRFSRGNPIVWDRNRPDFKNLDFKNPLRSSGFLKMATHFQEKSGSPEILEIGLCVVW